MIRSIKNNISYNLQNAIGKRVREKILVIESDDWGSIRMPSITSYNNLLKQGFDLDKSPYNRLDRLESEEDILGVFEHLRMIKDHTGNNLKITANFIMANPDFDKIASSSFNEYHHINLRETYNRYNGNSTALDLIKEGINNGLFLPQLHGREHLHPIAWLEALKNGDQETLTAFSEHVWGHPSTYFKNSKMNFSSAYHLTSDEHNDFAKQAIREAGRMFEEEFGFKSASFIAPRYIWDEVIEKELFEIGVQYIQGKIIQLFPNPKDPHRLKIKLNYLGKTNKYGQLYLIRNVFFEPAQNPRFDWIKDAFNRINIAFTWSKPAIVSMHRINFMGGLYKENRINNLSLLQTLIQKVQAKHPEVIFMTSNELGNLIKENEYKPSSCYNDARL